MGRDVITSFRVDEELWREVRAYAVRHGMTVKQLIEFLLRRELRENRALKELVKEVEA
jgi:antitoxin component of RelBE/YafQ-DinJ toxin-antitoxin module